MSEAEMPERVYTSEPQLRRPRQFLAGMMDDLRSSRGLAWVLFVRDLRVQYRESVLGYFWLIIPPMVTALVWIYLSHARIITLDKTDTPYALFAVTGVMVWQIFVDALYSPLRQVLAARSMLAKLRFPTEALVLAGLLTVGFNAALRLVLVLAMILALGMAIPASAVLAIPCVLLLALLGLTLGVLLLPLGMLYQDVERGLGVAVTLWFFLTPVIYPPPSAGLMTALILANPVTPLLVTARELLTTGNVSMAGGVLVVAAVSMVLLILVWMLNRLAKPHVIARLGAR